MKRHVPLVAAIAAMTVLSGCTSAVDGTPTSSTGMVPASTLSSAPTTTRTRITEPVTSTTAAPIPTDVGTLMQDIATDAAAYWAELGVTVTPRVVAGTDHVSGWCDGRSNRSWVCKSGLIMYDKRRMQALLDEHGADAVSVVAAHEVTHLALAKLDPNKKTLNVGGAKEEALAQCGSGAYARWVVEGESPRYSTTGPEVEAGLDGAYPAEGIGTSLTPDEIAPLREAYQRGYTSGKPCLDPDN